jgi:hypothetical protein
MVWVASKPAALSCSATVTRVSRMVGNPPIRVGSAVILSHLMITSYPEEPPARPLTGLATYG